MLARPPADLSSKAEALAACLAVERVRIERHPSNAGWALVVAMAADPLSRPSPAWPWLGLDATSAWWPIPVGVDENGTRSPFTLPEHHVLLGGEPGAGKSVALSQIVAAAALDPSVGLWLLDGKPVELAEWHPVAHRCAGVEINDAIAVPRELQQIADARYSELLETGKRKIEPGARLEVVVIDELAHYLTPRQP